MYIDSIIQIWQNPCNFAVKPRNCMSIVVCSILPHLLLSCITYKIY